MSLNDEGAPGWLKKVVSSVGQVTQKTTFSTRSTVVTVWINGKKHTLDTTSGVRGDILRQITSQTGISLEEATSLLQSAGDDILRQITSQTGISLEQATRLLESSGVLQSLQTADSDRVRQTRGRATMTVCAKCHRKVPQSATCLYCGQTLENKERINEVDRKFLEGDVIGDDTSKQTQQVRDTFEDRLKNL